MSPEDRIPRVTDKGFLFPGEFHTPCLPSLTLALSDCSPPLGNRPSYGAAESCVVNCPREQNLSTLASKGQDWERGLPAGDDAMGCWGCVGMGIGVCGGRGNRRGPSLHKGHREGISMWALGQGEVTERRTGLQGGCEAGSGLPMPGRESGF